MTGTDENNIYIQAQGSAFASFMYFSRLHAHFAADADRALQISKEKANLLLNKGIEYKDYTYYTRSLVRSFFAYVEGATYLMRQVALWAHSRGDLVLSDEELFRLSEGALGQSSAKRGGFNPIWVNLDLGVGYFAKCFHSDFSIDKQSAGWSRFRSAVRVRNAIVHPKTIESFYPSLDDIKAVMQSIVWFHTQMRDLMDSCKVVPPSRSHESS